MDERKILLQNPITKEKPRTALLHRETIRKLTRGYLSKGLKRTYGTSVKTRNNSKTISKMSSLMSMLS
jgi:hypothetical protein